MVVEGVEVEAGPHGGGDSHLNRAVFRQAHHLDGIRFPPGEVLGESIIAGVLLKGFFCPHLIVQHGPLPVGQTLGKTEQGVTVDIPHHSAELPDGRKGLGDKEPVQRPSRSGSLAPTDLLQVTDDLPAHLRYIPPLLGVNELFCGAQLVLDVQQGLGQIGHFLGGEVVDLALGKPLQLPLGGLVRDEVGVVGVAPLRRDAVVPVPQIGELFQGPARHRLGGQVQVPNILVQQRSVCSRELFVVHPLGDVQQAGPCLAVCPPLALPLAHIGIVVLYPLHLCRPLLPLPCYGLLSLGDGRLQFSCLAVRKGGGLLPHTLTHDPIKHGFRGRLDGVCHVVAVRVVVDGGKLV